MDSYEQAVREIVNAAIVDAHWAWVDDSLRRTENLRGIRKKAVAALMSLRRTELEGLREWCIAEHTRYSRFNTKGGYSGEIFIGMIAHIDALEGT